MFNGHNTRVILYENDHNLWRPFHGFDRHRTQKNDASYSCTNNK